MKLLKANIEVIHPDAKSTKYNYPGEWLENKEPSKMPAVLFPENRSDEFERGGRIYQTLYPVVTDEVADILLALGGDFSLAELADVQAYADKHAPQRVIPTDASKVLEILAKNALGGVLTEEDRAALDPNNPTSRGLSISQSFIDLAKEYGCDNI